MKMLITLEPHDIFDSNFVYCNTGTLILVHGLYICQDLAVDEPRVRGATRLWVRLGRTDCGERNNTQEI